jgi:predicted RNA-binding Zn-ribbon protein involved in translation (DUF1610 family)
MTATAPGGTEHDHVCPKCGALLSPHGGDAVQTSLVRVDCPSCGAVVAVRVKEAQKKPPLREKSRLVAMPAQEEARGGALYMFAGLVVCLITGMVIATHCDGPQKPAPPVKIEPPIEAAPTNEAEPDDEAAPQPAPQPEVTP